MSTTRRIVKNFLSLSSGQMASQFVTFLAIVYLARVLGTANFGKLSFAQATVIYFLLVSDLGLRTLGIREVARHRDRLANYVDNILTLKLILAFFSFCLLLLFTASINKSAEIKYLIIFYGLCLFPSALLTEWFFQGIEKMEFVGMSKILNRSLYAALVLILIKTHKQLLLVPYLWLAGFIASTIFLLRIFIRQFGRIKLVFNFPLWKGLLYTALPMGFAWMMIQIYNNFDTIMLGFMKTDQVVGWYNAAYKVIFFIFMLGGYYVTAIFPVISRYYKESSERLSILLSHSVKLMVTVGLPLGVGGTILGKPLMRLFYGTQYDNGIIAFQILIWYVVISFICMMYANSLLACNKERKYAMGVMLAAITNLVLNIFLIPPFGLKGAAIATVAAEGVLFVYAYREFQRIIKVEFKKYLLSPLVSALFMGGFLYLNQNWNLFLLIVSGMVIYTATLFLTKGISQNDLMLAKRYLLKEGRE